MRNGIAEKEIKKIIVLFCEISYSLISQRLAVAIELEVVQMCTVVGGAGSAEAWSMRKPIYIIVEFIRLTGCSVPVQRKTYNGKYREDEICADHWVSFVASIRRKWSLKLSDPNEA